MFKDRIDAGQQLVEKLGKYSEGRDVVVLGIPRGGVVVASVVAKSLDVPLDIVVVKKVGAPGNEEFAIGATGIEFSHIDRDRVKQLGVGEEFVKDSVEAKKKEARDRYAFLSGGKSQVSVEGKNVILIDDGIATGETMALAVEIIRKRSPKKIIVAVPVASVQSLDSLKADEIVCILKEKNLMAIGQFYENFDPVEDSEVRELLKDGRG